VAKLDATTDDAIARQIAEDADTAPEWTEEDFDRAEVWHGDHYLGRGKDVRAGRPGRPKGSGKKELVTLRLDHVIIDRFRAGGPGWQTRLNDALLGLVKPLSRGKGVQIGDVISVEALTLPPMLPRRRPQRGTNARLIAEVLKAMPSGTARPAEIHAALQRDKGVRMAFTSIRHALGQLKAGREVEEIDDGKSWRYLGVSA
jgi:uncharacterized protein (DUF4415 family)